PRTTRRLESRLTEVAENLCKLATVTGHTKSGKTVLVRTAFPPEDTIWVDGGTIGDEDDFWSSIIEQEDLFQSSAETVSSSRASTIGGEGTAEANFLLAKGSGTVSAELETSRGELRSDLVYELN